jgi:2Fe-2S ferredoxin
MPKFTFITHDGQEHVVEGEIGSSVMEAAIDANVPGIDADCGGGCSCATCHVYVDEKWIDVVGKPDGMEEDMLGLNPERTERSRLTCQIPVSEELDGLVVRVPEFQM